MSNLTYCKLWSIRQQLVDHGTKNKKAISAVHFSGNSSSTEGVCVFEESRLHQGDDDEGQDVADEDQHRVWHSALHVGVTDGFVRTEESSQVWFT